MVRSIPIENAPDYFGWCPQVVNEDMVAFNSRDRSIRREEYVCQKDNELYHALKEMRERMSSD